MAAARFYPRFFACLLLAAIHCSLNAIHSTLLTLSADQEDYQTQIAAAFPEPFTLTQLSYSCDVTFSETEFRYLVDFKEGQQVSSEQMSCALFHLFKKNKFQTITIRATPHDQGMAVHFAIEGFWTFYKLKMRGIVLNKDVYRQYYSMESGDPFDEAKHAASLEQIINAFRDEGYFNGSIDTQLLRDEKNKLVTVHLWPRKGDRFSIRSAALAFTPESTIDAQQKDLIRTKKDKVFKRVVGSTYNRLTLNEQTRTLKRSLFNAGFVQVSIELQETIDHKNKKVDLTFMLDVYRKKEFVFFGNHFFSNEKLLEMMALFGRSVWLLPASILQQEIETAYQKAGFWNVAITAREDADKYFFLINEGHRASVTDILLINCSYADQARLIKQQFGSLLKHSYFDADTANTAIDSLINFYVQEGYLDFAIHKQEYVPMEEPNEYALALTLNEGPCYRVRRVTIPGYTELLVQEPFALINASENGVPFTMQLIHEQRQWLINHFKKLGVQRASISPDYQKVDGSIALTWKINITENKAVFGKTIVQGSCSLPFEYMLRELNYANNESWDSTKVKHSLKRLKALNIFEQVQLYPCTDTFAPPLKPMLLKVQKDDPYELRLRGGLAVQQLSKSLRNAGLTYRIGGSFFIKNPFNYADLLTFEAEVDRSQRLIQGTYQLPWLFNKPIRTIIQAYGKRYEQPGLHGPIKNLYRVEQDGILVGLTRTFPHSELGINFGFEVNETTTGQDKHAHELFADRLARAINFTPRLLDKKIPYLLFEPTYLVDFLDDRINSTRGSFTLVTLKGMIPVGRIGWNSFFVRLSIEESLFLSVGSVVFGLRFKFGHIFHQQFSAITPTERFYLGGANSVRSYETDRCPPLGIFVEEGQCPQYVPRGGKTVVNINAEVRFPIYRNIIGAVFQDIGALSGDNIWEFRDNPILAGTGVGLRYFTPIGPLRFDLAWKWSLSHPDEARYAWFVTFGHAF